MCLDMHSNYLPRRAFVSILAASSFMVAATAAAKQINAKNFGPFAALERRAGGKLGVCALNTQSGDVVQHRGDERFGMCSTFKLPLVAMVLREVDQKQLRFDQAVPLSQADKVAFAPVASKFLDGGNMSVEAMAEAAQVYSDNVAANKLLGLLGGPAGFTSRLRDLGDQTTRLDRYETELNVVPPGEERDTTTPHAMAQTLQSILTSPWLSASSKAKLKTWMNSTATGTRRLRAGFPEAWSSGDKTGTAQVDGLPDRINDIGATWPPGQGPIVIAAYYEAPGGYQKVRAEDEAVLAEVGRIVATWARA
jgi:beta-lactamase class A